MGRTTMVPLHRLLSGIVLLLWVVSSLPAQELPCSQRTILATVIDREGNPVRGLSAADFRGEFRGHAVQIISATLDTRPRRMVIVLDASGSMIAPKAKWDAVQVLASDALRFAPSGSSMALLIFSSTVLDKTGLESGPGPLARRLALLAEEINRPRKGFGKTALWDAIQAGLAHLDPPQQGDVIYAITDGGDNASKAKPGEVQEALLRAGVRLFAFLMMEPLPLQRTPEEANRPRKLEEVAEATGGDLFALLAGGSLLDRRASRAGGKWASTLLAVKRLYEEMWRFYRIDIRLPSGVDKPRDWKLQVTEENGRARRDLKVHYTRRLLPCSPVGTPQ